MFSGIPDFSQFIRLIRFCKNAPKVKILRLACQKTVIFDNMYGVYDKKNIFKKQPKVSYKTYSRSIFQNSRVCALSCLEHDFFFNSQLFCYLGWILAKSMNPWWKILCPQEGPNMVTISNPRDFSQSKNSGMYDALNRQKRLTHTSKTSKNHVFRDSRDEKWCMTKTFFKISFPLGWNI